MLTIPGQQLLPSSWINPVLGGVRIDATLKEFNHQGRIVASETLKFVRKGREFESALARKPVLNVRGGAIQILWEVQVVMAIKGTFQHYSSRADLNFNQEVTWRYPSLPTRGKRKFAYLKKGNVPPRGTVKNMSFSAKFIPQELDQYGQVNCNLILGAQEQSSESISIGVQHGPLGASYGRNDTTLTGGGTRLAVKVPYNRGLPKAAPPAQAVHPYQSTYSP